MRLLAPALLHSFCPHHVFRHANWRGQATKHPSHISQIQSQILPYTPHRLRERTHKYTHLHQPHWQQFTSSRHKSNTNAHRRPTVLPLFAHSRIPNSVMQISGKHELQMMAHNNPCCWDLQMTLCPPCPTAHGALRQLLAVCHFSGTLVNSHLRDDQSAAAPQPVESYGGDWPGLQPPAPGHPGDARMAHGGQRRSGLVAQGSRAFSVAAIRRHPPNPRRPPCNAHSPTPISPPLA